MSNNKRLFLFAGYSTNGTLDDALVYYIRELSKCGDVILYMDSNCPKSELDRVKKFTIARMATRHYEYDFGSYKRAYEYAKKHKILDNYDFVYMANDSVYGPLHKLKPILEQMESYDTDAWGLTESVHTHYCHIQSWFIGMRESVFKSNWFDTFIMNVKRQEYKYLVTVLYENRFTDLVVENGGTWRCPFKCPGRSVYNNPKHLFKIGCPFIKKMSFTRHNGAIGYQLNYVLSHCDKTAACAIKNAANNAYTSKYMSWLLTKNPITPIWRGITYAIQKLRKK
jgi:lipopolysaccharide biosynthesis protein